MTTNGTNARVAAPGGAALWVVLMLNWLPAAAQDAPSPRQGPPDMSMPHPPGGMGGPGMAGPGMGGPGPDGMRGGGPLSDLAKAEADQAAGQAIADLSHAPLADAQRVVRTWGVPTALRYFDVTPMAFHDTVTPRLVGLVKSAVRDQLVSQAEADAIVERLQHHGPPPPAPPQ